MKTSNQLKFTFILLLFFTAQHLNAQTSDDIWDFPIRPGTSEWKAFKNSYEKISACQIPNEVLSNLTTDQLVEICLRYPLLLDILAFNNILDGFIKYENDFNGFKELISRKDVAIELLQKYKKMNPLDFKENWESYEMGDLAMKISMTELFLSHNQVLSKLSSEDKKSLLREFQLKKDQKNSKRELYTELCIQTIYLSIVKVMESENIDLGIMIDMESAIPYITKGVLTKPEVKMHY